MIDPGDDKEFRDLVDTACEGRLNDVQRSELQDYLRRDDSYCRWYLNYCRMNTDLHFLTRAEAAEQAAVATIVDGNESEAARIAEESTHWSWLGAALEHLVAPARHPWRFAGAALALTVVIWAGFFVFVLSEPDDPQQPKMPSVNRGPVIVATLARDAGAVWGDPNLAVAEGYALRREQELKLASGVVQIRFKSGARVVLQGPAHMQLTSINSVRLQAGALTARVPKAARGFQVVTPSAQLIDLGTEFSVVVDADGESQMHVYEGQVEARSLDAAGSVQGIVQVTAGQGVRIDSTHPDIVPCTVDTQGLVRTMPKPVPRLAIDFASSTMDKAFGHRVEPGFRPFARPTSGATPSGQTETYSSGLGRTGQVAVSLATDSGRLTWRDRGQAPHAARGALVEDFVTTNGGMIVSLRGLAPGEYRLTTYHHDLRAAHGTIAIAVDDAEGSRIVSEQFSMSGQHESPAYAMFRFRAGDEGLASFTFSRAASPHVVINGLVLERMEHEQAAEQAEEAPRELPPNQ